MANRRAIYFFISSGVINVAKLQINPETATHCHDLAASVRETRHFLYAGLLRPRPVQKTGAFLYRTALKALPVQKKASLCTGGLKIS